MPATGDVRAIVDRDPLERSYTPDSIVGRTRETAALRRSMEEGLAAGDPSHVAVYGTGGTGKTLLVDVVARDLRSRLDPVPDVARVSCASEQRAYRVAIAVVNALRAEDALASTGYPLEAVLETLSTDLAARSDPLLLVLDDVQALDLESAALRELFDVLLTDAAVTVVVVADDPRFRNDLEWSLRQRFAGREVHFPPYERETLADVVADRVDAAFRDDVVDDAVIEHCAAAAVEDGGGSAWTAIQLLAGAARNAGERSSGHVTCDDVDSALAALRAAELRDALPDSPHAGLALLALTASAVDPERQSRMRHCYGSYQDLCSTLGYEPVGERAVHGYLRALRRADFLDTERRHSDSPGQFYVYDLLVEPDVVVAALRETELPEAAFDATVLER